MEDDTEPITIQDGIDTSREFVSVEQAKDSFYKGIIVGMTIIIILFILCLVVM